MSDTPPKRNSFLKMLMWWKIEPATLTDQIEKYNSLGWSSARRISASLLALSCVLTLAMVAFNKNYDLILDVILLGFFAIFVSIGFRWAILGAMILWTWEKGYLMLSGAGNNPVVQVIWWALYMNYLYLAWTVENERIKRPNSPPPAGEISSQSDSARNQKIG